jgi:hypothetical protein
VYLRLAILRGEAVGGLEEGDAAIIQPVERFDPGGIRSRPGGFRRAAPAHRDAARFGCRSELACQRGFADAGFSADQGNRSASALRTFEGADERVELVLTADHGRHRGMILVLGSRIASPPALLPLGIKAMG